MYVSVFSTRASLTTLRIAVAILALAPALACSSEGGDQKDSDGDGSSGMNPTGGAAGTTGGFGGSSGANGGTSGAGMAGDDSSGSGGAAAGGSSGSAGTDAGTVPLPEGARERAGVLNLVDEQAAAALEGFLNVESSEAISEGLKRVTNVFLETYVEQYDFIFLFSDHDLDSLAAGRYASVTQRAQLGTGIDYDVESEGFKTSGRLRGFIGINYAGGGFGPLGHEIAHHWANFLDPEFGFGVGLDEDFGPHWGYTGQKGILGGFDAATLRCETPAGAMLADCTPEASSRFRYRVGSFGQSGNATFDVLFSPLELYLMGFIPFAELPSPIMVLEEATELSGSFDAQTMTVGLEAAGVKWIDAQALVERHGLVSELPAAERAFAAAFIVVSAMPAEDAVLDQVAERAAIFGNRSTSSEAHSFEALTGGRATLDTVLGPRRSVAEPPPSVRAPRNCDVYMQDCDSGKACYFATFNSVCGFAGTGIRDEICTVNTECAPGFECSPNLESDSYTCQPYCGLDAQAPDYCGNLCDWWLLTNDAGVDIARVCQTP